MELTSRGTPRKNGVRTKEQIQQDILLRSKVCNRCGRRRNFLHFPNSKKGADGHDGICYSCKPKRNLRYNIKSRYGVSLAEFNEMLVAQESKCAICGKEQMGKQLAIDHDHTTGEIRGLLCSNCNTGIGLLGDNPSILQAAINYLSREKQEET